MEQNLQGLLSVRFLATGQLDPIAQEHLVFAGVLESEQTAMRCGDDGRCNPHWPARLAVATVAAARFDLRGLVMGLPRTHLARGHCQLERTQVSCQARGPEGTLWSAEASLSAAPAVAGSQPR